MKLDTFCKRNNIRVIDFIKIDVEGYEYFVIKGGLGIIKKYKPDIFFETNIYYSNITSISVYDIYCIIKDLNYNAYGLSYGWKAKLKKINLNTVFLDVKKYSDILLTQKNLYK